jgi:excinuclease UvrABC nuclease subunit
MKSKWEISPFGPPADAGVYCIYNVNVDDKHKTLLYIGSSNNIARRLMDMAHPYRVLMAKTAYPNVISVKFKECNNYLELEKRLIRRLRPSYNVQLTRP